MNSFISWEAAVAWLRAQPDMSSLVRDCYYDDPLSAAAARFYESTEWCAVRNLLSVIKQEDKNALDIGAGRGISSYALAKDGWKVTALEPDPSYMVGAGAIKQLCNENVLDIRVIESAAESLPFADCSFELVYTRQSLHHVNDLEAFCSEVKRVLRPGGLFLATREHVIDREEDLQRFLDAHPLHNMYGGEHAYTLGRYLAAMKGAGLQVVEILATYDSEINLFPITKKFIRDKIKQKTGIQVSSTIFDCLVAPLLNMFIRTPGRLYTFVGKSPA